MLPTFCKIIITSEAYDLKHFLCHPESVTVSRISIVMTKYLGESAYEGLFQLTAMQAYCCHWLVLMQNSMV